MTRFSLIIPVFNRPDEVDELLASAVEQNFKDFEIIVVEDGSTTTCDKICEKWSSTLSVKYYYKSNSGPGPSRNYGAERANGEYIIILDSDVVLPANYLQCIDQHLKQNLLDAFGGPDAAHPSFTDVQKAISYSMTSFLTTGGIRGGKKKMDKFYPRSFNMGIRREVYQALQGFAPMRFGEDIDFSIRIYKAGYRCSLIPEAWVWHKRRTDFRKFYRQVYNSGIARINLYKKYPESLKTVHLLPALFTVAMLLSWLCIPIGWSLHQWGQVAWITALGKLLLNLGIYPTLVYAGAIFADAVHHKNSFYVSWLCIIASFTQLMGYGSGFIHAWWQRCVRGKDNFSAFNKTFYK